MHPGWPGGTRGVPPDTPGKAKEAPDGFLTIFEEISDPHHFHQIHQMDF